MLKNKLLLVLSFLIFFVAFVYRVFGILNNHPFWVDEYSSANQARLILENGLNLFRDPSINVEQHNFVTHALIALFFKIFGEQEWAARLPFVMIGSLVPVMVFFLTKKLFDTRTAVSAALLTTFSYFQITWSRQARGYVLIQLLVLITTYLYIQLKNNYFQSKKHIAFLSLLLALTIGVGFFTHALFLIFLAALATDVLIFNFNFVKKLMRNIYVYIFLALLLGLSFQSGQANEIKQWLLFDIFRVNNLWYYHSFLWREYGLITFLALVGFLMSIVLKKERLNLIVFYIVFQLFFISFLLPAYVSRYLLPIFPFLFIGASFAIVSTTDLFLKHQKLDKIKILHRFLAITLVLFIIGNGHKFVTKPKQFYSINHDFREIALIDYHRMYNIIKTKGQLEEGRTAVIDTWHDRLYWYLGRDYQPAYIFRWIDEPGTVNGLPKKTVFTYNKKGEKVLPKTNDLKLIGEFADLQKAMKKYSRGFIFIDDSSLPKDVREYAKKNFKKEIYLDRYPLDDNPYSVWPATLYSWGIESKDEK